eukprot:4950695-Amphidinium_carterae.1
MTTTETKSRAPEQWQLSHTLLIVSRRNPHERCTVLYATELCVDHALSLAAGHKSERGAASHQTDARR